MASNKVMLLCSHCSWKKVCELENTGLYELKSDSMSSRKYRCPQCGRAIAPRKFPDPQSDADRIEYENRIKAENESFLEENAEFQKNFLKEVSEDE